ncbi:hypothetical protein [Streptomyces sp. NPDC052042]|uniref:hypothetical protein n=1 Tax=Streptomyces sp. NPDC052042 TaxID=3365683 RepID=UPI0037D3DA6E
MSDPTDFERGVRAGAESMRLYFVDENEQSMYPELTTEVIGQHEKSAVADALADERSRMERVFGDAVIVPSEYRILPKGYADSDADGKEHFVLRITWRGTDPETGADRWAVLDHCGDCLSADGTWEWEPRPSSRDDDWLARFRHTREDALRLAAAAVNTLKLNGRTFAQWEEHFASLAGE